jgi:hypothetical protein
VHLAGWFFSPEFRAAPRRAGAARALGWRRRAG